MRILHYIFTITRINGIWTETNMKNIFSPVMSTLLGCTVHISVWSTNSCILLLLSNIISLNKLPVLNDPFLFTLKWKK